MTMYIKSDGCNVFRCQELEHCTATYTVTQNISL